MNIMIMLLTPLLKIDMIWFNAWVAACLFVVTVFPNSVICGSNLANFSFVSFVSFNFEMRVWVVSTEIVVAWGDDVSSCFLPFYGKCFIRFHKPSAGFFAGTEKGTAAVGEAGSVGDGDRLGGILMGGGICWNGAVTGFFASSFGKNFLR